MTIDIIEATRLIGPGMARTALAQLRKKKSVRLSTARGMGKPQQQDIDEQVLYDSLRLMRKVMEFVCMSTIEDLHAITSRHAPPPPWAGALVRDVEVPSTFYGQAAELVQAQLGRNLDKVGRTWWQWRKLGSTVRAQWVEMKMDHEERVARKDPGTKVIFYVHGGAYYIGGIGHDIQIQRHARKLKGRCFAPRYRLAPQFPFPCAIQDILSAYLYLLTIVEPTHIVIEGDSAGGGLCLALLLIIRDQGLPAPAGACLISPWVDLTHSFPSINMPADFDYVPSYGFHAKPSLSWPPPTLDERRVLGIPENTSLGPDYEVDLDGQPHTITEQIHMYAPNQQLALPMVSPILAATLGGFCPCQVIVGGGELLRDEQLFLAHKMADPAGFPLPEEIWTRNGENPSDIDKFPPTAVELLVFDDGPHAAPTLGHIDIAKHQYRAISQFAAWALARAQNVDIEIEDYSDEYITTTTTPSPVPPTLYNSEWAPPVGNQPVGNQKVETDQDSAPRQGFVPDQKSASLADHAAGLSLKRSQMSTEAALPQTLNSVHPADYAQEKKQYVGLRAGDALPPFADHMIRCRVDRQGRLYPLEPPYLIPALQLPREQIGIPKGDTLKG